MDKLIDDQCKILSTERERHLVNYSDRLNYLVALRTLLDLHKTDKEKQLIGELITLFK